MYVPKRRNLGLGRGLLALVCAALVVLCAYKISAAGQGIVRERIMVGGTPVDIFRPGGGESRPAVIVAHGFSGSRQIMYAIGYTLAHNGYLAALLDFPGHGRNQTPMDQIGVMRDVTQLTEALGGVVDYVRARDDVIGSQVALLGHSMGTAVAMTYGLDHADVGAVIAFSAILTDITPSAPRNLLLQTGDLEFANMKQNALAALQNGGGQTPAVLYGEFAQGTARRLDFVPNAEHVTILFSRLALARTAGWLDASFGRSSGLWLDNRMIWLLGLYAAALALFFPLSGFLWQPSSALRGRRMGFWQILLFTGVPALLTPVVLRLVSPVTEIIPLLVANYLAVYFCLTGIGTLILLRRSGLLERRIWRHWLRPGCVGAGLALFLYIVAAVFIPGDLTWASMIPTGQRVIWFLVMALLCFPYFLAETSLTYARGRGQTLWRFLLTKAIFLASMLLALQLTPGLFFMLLLLPFLLLAWAMFGAYATRATARLGSPVPAAIAMTLAFAWFMAALFPLI